MLLNLEMWNHSKIRQNFSFIWDFDIDKKEQDSGNAFELESVETIDGKSKFP